MARPELLRTDDVVMGLANGTGAYALDMDLLVLHNDPTGWSRVD